MDVMRRIRDLLVELWIKQQIATFHQRGGKVVVITGSYGKTSVKELSYDLLRHKYEVVRTGRNYNTAVGIAKTLRYEVTRLTELLVIEVGAYHIGEISEFCRILKPDVGVITGIARQHLTRFGSWENIIYAKTEIARYIQTNGGKLIANGSDKTVVNQVKNATFYYGSSREEVNQNAARQIAMACGVSKKEIERYGKYWRAVPSRFEMTNDRYGMRVIDDSYNSNEVSFAQAVEYLGKQKKYLRIIVTPGLLELGEDSASIHRELGKLIGQNCDLAILVGKSERTTNLARGIDSKIKVVWIEKTLDFMAKVKSLKLKKEPLILLENDIPQDMLTR